MSPYKDVEKQKAYMREYARKNRELLKKLLEKEKKEKKWKVRFCREHIRLRGDACAQMEKGEDLEIVAQHPFPFHLLFFAIAKTVRTVTI